jgi:putative endonuclease
VVDGFTKRYRLTRLVWVERHDSIAAAIQREKTMKHCVEDPSDRGRQSEVG